MLISIYGFNVNSYMGYNQYIINNHSIYVPDKRYAQGPLIYALQYYKCLYREIVDYLVDQVGYNINKV